MKTTSSSDLQPMVRRFIEDGGNMTQSLGLGRVLGQIYTYLYFSSGVRNLADMQAALGISKGSASTGVRQLEQWGAARKIWVKGDRKDYYEANDWFGEILRNAVTDTVGKRISTYTSLIDDAQKHLQDLGAGDGEGDFIRKRIEHLRAFQSKIEKLWANPIVRMILK
jgi:HTH-type transcriptional regulator, glycine betaine synthesis regulator